MELTYAHVNLARALGTAMYEASLSPTMTELGSWTLRDCQADRDMVARCQATVADVADRAAHIVKKYDARIAGAIIDAAADHAKMRQDYDARMAPIFQAIQENYDAWWTRNRA